MKRSHLAGVVLLLLPVFSFADEKIYINELMPSNIDYIIDDLFDFPDSWVELYNPTEEDVNLKNWYLSNKKSNLTLWRIPVDCIVPSNGYKLIYMDEVDENLHASFRLDIGGDRLYLTKPDGNTVMDTSEKFKSDIPANNAWARIPDGSDNWGWINKPTPGKTNDDNYFNTIVAPQILFNVPSGLYEEFPFIEMSVAEDKSELANNIYYTTDGSEPTERSNRYTEPLIIDSTSVIRAKIINENYIIRRSDAISLIHKTREMNHPVISLIMEPEHLWDDSIGIYVDGVNGKYFHVTKQKHNWNQDWRRPMHIDFIDKDNNVTVNQDGELCIMGGESRRYPMKSLKIYANKRFGKKRLDYKFFHEKDAIDGGYKSIILRNSGQDFDWTFCKDALNQYLMAQKADLDYQAYQPAIVFINGQYWGMQNIRERSNDHHILSNFGLDDDEIDMYENKELKNGTSEHFDMMYEYVTGENVEFGKIDEYIDVNEFVNYIVLETFISNRDWIYNNVVMWRKRDGGKWRWLIKDTDYSQIGYNNRTIEWLLEYEGSAYMGNIFNGCMKDNTFKNKFIDNYQAYMGDFLDGNTAKSLLDSIYNNLDDEMHYHQPRWEGTYDDWKAHHTNMIYYMRRRADSTYMQMHRLFDLGFPVKTEISITPENIFDGNDIEKQVFSINGVGINKNRFNGRLFTERDVNLKIEKDILNSPFECWLVKTKKQNGETETDIYHEKEINLNFDGLTESIEINAVFKDRKPYFDFDNGCLTISNYIAYDYISYIRSEIEKYKYSATTLDLRNTVIEDNVNTDELFAEINPNCIILANNENITLTGNFVNNEKAKNIVLNNGYDFNNHIDFDADTAVVYIKRYTNHFHNEKAYYPMILPFASDDFISDENLAYKYIGGKFLQIYDWAANQPFVIENISDGSEYIRLEFENVRFEKTNDSLFYANSESSLWGGYKWNRREECLVINKDFVSGHMPGNAFISNAEAVVRPFESFIYDPNFEEITIPELTLDIKDIVETEFGIVLSGNRVNIFCNDSMTINIYTVDGRIVKSFAAQPGENSFIIEDAGVYFINNKKVVIK